ncbi:DinB family protein [Acidobacteriota bacterium]
MKNIWNKANEYTMEFVQAMPGEKYGFKPTDEVFSFAEHVLHLVGSNFWFFSSIKGEKPPKSEEALKSEGKSKEDVIKLLEESNKYGDGVLNGLTDEMAKEEVPMGKNKLAKWKMILFCSDHITHHRGQMVVYLRLNGIKPPQYRSGLFG